MVGSTVILIVQGVILLLPDRLWIPLEVEMFMTHAILYRKDIKKVLSLAKKLLIPTGGGTQVIDFPLSSVMIRRAFALRPAEVR